MYQLKISQWFGRLGNNLQQLSNAIYIAEKTRSILSFPFHQMITESYFDFSDGRSCKHQILSDFWNDKLESFAVTIEEIEEKRTNILRNNILPLLPYKSKKQDFDMVIHFRGGDIFRKNPHHNMVQAPYSYFKRVLEIQDAKRVLLVCEDNKNLEKENALKFAKKKNLLDNGKDYQKNLSKFARAGFSYEVAKEILK